MPNPLPPRRPFLIVLVICSLAIALPAATSAPAAQAQEPPPLVYLPFVTFQLPPPAFMGTVMLDGQPAAHVALLLAGTRPNGSHLYESTTQTDASGAFRFDVTTLLPTGTRFQINYDGLSPLEPGGTPVRTNCSTQQYAGVEAGAVVDIGTLDVSPIRLLEPRNGATVRLPTTFRWLARPDSPEDSYNFVLADSDSSEEGELVRLDLGYVDSHVVTHADLAGFLQVGETYSWRVWAREPGPDVGSCTSYYYFEVQFRE